MVVEQPHDPDGVRRDSEYILDQARWLYDLHAQRSTSAQQRATAVMAFAGGVLALAPNALPVAVSGPQGTALLATLTLAVATIGLAMGSLLPRKTEGPSVAALRKLWADHQKQNGPVDHVHQITETLLRSTVLDKDSFLDLVRREADVRVKRLRWAYWTLAAALVAVSALTTLTAIAK